MNNYQLILPEHLNHYGYLFGGTLLKWVDESAYISARLEHPGRSFVTIGLEKVNFKKKVELGSILCFSVEKKRTGKTSVTYQVVVKDIGKQDDNEILTTLITFVCMDKEGNKCNLTSND